MSNYPGGFASGVTMRNMPVVNAHAGKVLWLDSVAGSDQNKGTFDRPFSTIDYAISQCTASNGDVIMVKPGHAENVADATTFQVDVAGVTIIGLGTGSNRPTFTFTNTAGSVELDAAGTVLENLRFVASVSAVVVGMNVDADYCEVRNCQFTFDATGDDFLIYIDCDGVSNTVIAGNEMIAELTAGSNEAIRLDDCDYTKIVGNYIFGDFANAAILGDTVGDTGDNLPVGILIAHNSIYNGDTSAQGKCIDLNVAATGRIEYNNLGGLGSGAANVSAKLDPGSCLCVENYASDAVDEKAIVVPTTASADT